DVVLQLPSLTFGGALSPDTPISLTALLDSMLGGTGGLPDVQVSLLCLGADPRTGYYSLAARLNDGQVTVGGYRLTEVDLELEKLSTGMTGGISAAITLAGSQLMVTGTYGPGWTVSGRLNQLSLTDLIGEVLADVALPNPLTSLQLANIAAMWNITTGA